MSTTDHQSTSNIIKALEELDYKISGSASVLRDLTMHDNEADEKSIKYISDTIFSYAEEFSELFCQLYKSIKN